MGPGPEHDRLAGRLPLSTCEVEGRGRGRLERGEVEVESASLPPPCPLPLLVPQAGRHRVVQGFEQRAREGGRGTNPPASLLPAGSGGYAVPGRGQPAGSGQTTDVVTDEMSLRGLMSRCWDATAAVLVMVSPPKRGVTVTVTVALALGPSVPRPQTTAGGGPGRKLQVGDPGEDETKLQLPPPGGPTPAVP
jgi:hypothetical protein